MFDLIPFARKYQPVSYYDPFREMEALERRFFGDSLFGGHSIDAPVSFRTDIQEQDNSYLLEADLPGFNKEDIQLDVTDNVLTISAEHKTENDEKDENGRYVKRERSYGAYRRSFDLSGIDEENIRAAYENGVLKLTLPKLIEQPKNSRKLIIE